MGHVRLGRLPKTRRWAEVISLLTDSSPEDVAAIASATVQAADRRLRELARDPSLTYCFWLLTRISWASRSRDFAASVAGLGIQTAESDSALTFIARLTGHAQLELAEHPESGPFSELASLAMRRALSETVGQQSRSLFGSSLEDLRTAFRRQSTPVRFGALARSFFGDFLARTLRFFVHKELANVVGPSRGRSAIDNSREFSEALDLHARQSARIMEKFARDWYSKNNWKSRGKISRGEADRFTAHAMRKIRSELAQPELVRAVS